MWRSQKFFLSEDFLAVASPALIIPLPANIFPNKLAPNVPNRILKKPPLCSFASSFIESPTPFHSIPESSRDLAISKMFFISSFEIIKVVL